MGNSLQRRLNRRRSAVKHVHACLSARKDGENGFHHRGGPVKLVQAYLCPKKNLQRRFNRRGGAVKHVQSCLKSHNQVLPVLKSGSSGQ